MKALSLVLTACLCALGSASLAFGQAAPKDKINKELVSFRTTDGVLLKGSFYPSSKGSNAPTIMYLHKWGGNRTQDGVETLALMLQEKGFAVLTFDFRGHGESTQISDPKMFWSLKHNLDFVKGYNATNLKKTISFKDFTNNAYMPYLVNDVAAARHDLDNRNDNGGCNTSNVIVIGAEEGAAIGYFWICSEYYRPAVYQNVNLFAGGLAPMNNDPAVEDVAGAIWLSFKKYPTRTTGVGGIQFPYGKFSDLTPEMREKVQMWFAHGEKDTDGARDAGYMYDTVLKADKAKMKLALTSKLAIKNTTLRGISLVGKKDLDTDDKIVKFIEAAVKARPNQAQKKRNASEFKPPWIFPTYYGFNQ